MRWYGGGLDVRSRTLQGVLILFSYIYRLTGGDLSGYLHH